ncbi:hypothetical protein Tco_0868208 [Tanacetum coccineum]
MVIKGEVLNDFPRFAGILITKFTAGSAVNLTLKMKGDMIIENLDLEQRSMHDEGILDKSLKHKSMLRIEILHGIVGTSGYRYKVLRSFSVERIEQGIG